jgi:uncharacterized protein HemY
MASDREKQFLAMVEEFPESPMGHFSLGKLYLTERRYAEAAKSIEQAVRLDPEYAAALVALGDAYASSGQVAKAKEVLTRARSTALGQSHQSLADEIDELLNGL